MNFSPFTSIREILGSQPDAAAMIRGSEKYRGIRGIMQLYQTNMGILVAVEVMGLPFLNNVCSSNIFAFHIHSGEQCSGNEEDPFANVMMHYNPYECEHPYHAGDMPPLFGNHGYALSVFLIDRITIEEVIGKTIVIHGKADDFTTQPSGDAGEKIACGQIKARQ